MNVLNLSNNINIDNQDSSVQPFPNPNFPACVFSPVELNENPSLKNTSQYINNPNCQPQKIDVTDSTQISNKIQDVLYINYDLNPTQGNQESFNLVFLIQNGERQNGQADMKIDGFVNIAFNKQSWGFFAISCDYETGQASIYFKVFDDSLTNNSFNKNFPLDYRNFALERNSELTIASVEQNDYFE